MRLPLLLARDVLLGRRFLEVPSPGYARDHYLLLRSFSFSAMVLLEVFRDLELALLYRKHLFLKQRPWCWHLRVDVKGYLVAFVDVDWAIQAGRLCNHVLGFVQLRSQDVDRIDVEDSQIYDAISLSLLSV